MQVNLIGLGSGQEETRSLEAQRALEQAELVLDTMTDLFIANEAGAELVGSINGRTSVANQGQIIEGIQRGVAEANSEQNALLRQQNDLLRSILEKDTSVRLNASAALGRITRQSMDMYANMVGG